MQRHDKRDKLPTWIAGRLSDAHACLSTDQLLTVASHFMRAMGQPTAPGALRAGLLSEAQANALAQASA